MTEVAGFRPSEDERRIIARTRAALGFKTDSEAIRYLVRKGAEALGPLKQDAVFRFRLNSRKRARSVTSAEIDAVVYDRP